MHISAGTQVIEAQMVIIGQPAQHHIRREMFLLYIELAAIAGRKDRSFAAVGKPAELLHGLNQLLWRKRHALAHVYGGSLVVNTECEEGHSISLMMSGSRQLSYFDRFRTTTVVYCPYTLCLSMHFCRSEQARFYKGKAKGSNSRIPSAPVMFGRRLVS